MLPNNNIKIGHYTLSQSYCHYFESSLVKSTVSNVIWKEMKVQLWWSSLFSWSEVSTYSMSLLWPEITMLTHWTLNNWYIHPLTNLSDRVPFFTVSQMYYFYQSPWVYLNAIISNNKKSLIICSYHLEGYQDNYMTFMLLQVLVVLITTYEISILYSTDFIITFKIINTLKSVKTLESVM